MVPGPNGAVSSVLPSNANRSRFYEWTKRRWGGDWLDPDWFRFGASSLLNDLLMQRTKLTTGRYEGPDYFTLD